MELETTERIERTERAGIPVFWTELSGAFTATLAFRCGVADERLPQRGITHLLEHVTLSTLGRREHPWNGCVNGATTVFMAEGERDEVLEFLRLVGEALVELPVERFELERRVLRAEAEGHDPGVVSRLLDHRFGCSGFGLLNYGEIGLRRLAPDDLRAWSAAHFTAGNAVVWMTGEPPDDLGFTLPDGPRRPQPALEPLELELPGYVAEGRGGVALAGLGDRSTALRVAMGVAGERLYDTVRAERGLAYAPTGGYGELDARTGHAFLGSDCADEHAPVVLEALWRTVRELASDGATSEELDRHRRQAARALNDPDRVRGHLGYHALGELLADPVLSDAELERELEALDAAAVASAMTRVAGTAILLGPDGCPPPDEGLKPLEPRPPEALTEGDAFTAFSKRKKLSRRTHGGSTLRVSERGVAWESEDSEPGSVHWDRCEAVIRKPSGALVLHQRDGAWMEVPTVGWDDETPFERLEQVIPPGRALPVCDQERFDAIQAVAARWMKPGDPAYALIDELPGLLVGEEELREVIPARQRLTLGLLVVTDKRVAWLSYKDEKGFDVPASAITKAYGANEQFELYFDGNVAKLAVEPGDAAPMIAAAVSRTEPDR